MNRLGGTTLVSAEVSAIRGFVEMNQTISNGRGGARKGAGRKPGSATKKTREIADKAAAEGTTPLEIMLRTMRAFADEADGAKDDRETQLKLLVAASGIAKDAAPYIHPRLQAIEHSSNDGGHVVLSDAERASRLATILERARRAAQGDAAGD